MSDQKTWMYKGSQADEGPNGNKDSISNWAKSYSSYPWWVGAFCLLSSTLRKNKLKYE